MQNYYKELEKIGCTKENLAKATAFLHKELEKRNDISGSLLDIEQGFFFAELIYFVSHAHPNFSSTLFTVPHGSHELKLTALEILVAKTYTMDELLDLPHYAITEALYILFEKNIDPKMARVEQRSHLIKIFAGEEEYAQAENSFLEKRRAAIAEKTSLAFTKLKIIDLLEKANLTWDNYAFAVRTFLPEEEKEKIMKYAPTGVTFEELVFPQFLPFVSALGDPGGTLGIATPFLVQGNLSNLSFLIMETILQDKHSDPSLPKVKKDIFLLHRKKALSILVDKPTFSDTSEKNPINELVDFYGTVFEESIFKDALETVQKAAHFIKGEYGDRSKKEKSS